RLLDRGKQFTQLAQRTQRTAIQSHLDAPWVTKQISEYGVFRAGCGHQQRRARFVQGAHAERCTFQLYVDWRIDHTQITTRGKMSEELAEVVKGHGCIDSASRNPMHLQSEKSATPNGCRR